MLNNVMSVDVAHYTYSVGSMCLKYHKDNKQLIKAESPDHK